MRGRTFAATVAALLVPVAAASAQGDPIMPLSEVRQGMQCRAYSVFQGTTVEQFDAEVLDIVGGEAGARILVKVSGGRIEETGVGAGFSGSPIYCPDQQGQYKNAGAISETIGDFGGFTVLATPIEAILATTVDPVQTRSAIIGARSLASPLTVRGLSPGVFAALKRAAKRSGVSVMQAPPASVAQAAPQPFRPGSAAAIGLSSGAVSVGAVGTVAYVDGDKVFAFGHAFDGAGRRSLFLQDAYVAAVINNPVQLPDIGGTYKFAGATADVGTITNDTFHAISGRVGALPAVVPIRVFTRDVGTNAQGFVEARAADETDIGTPAVTSAMALVAPLTIAQAASGMYPEVPTRLAGDMCLRIVLRERPKPIRICNRYVSDGSGTSAPPIVGNVVALAAGNDVAEVVNQIDAYKPAALHVTEVAARLTMRRGQHQAYMRKLELPRTVRPGRRVTAKLTVQVVRGERRTISFKLRIPSGMRRGLRQIVLRGSDPDGSDEDLFGALTIEIGGDEGEGGGAEGPKNLDDLVREMRSVERYDGIRLGRRRGPKVYRDEDLRIGGRAAAFVRVVRKK